MWIERLFPEVQGRGLWTRGRTINRAGPWEIRRAATWENPARITPTEPIQSLVISLNGLLSFNNPERIEAGLPHPLTIP